MTMGCNCGKYTGTFALYFVYIVFCYPVFAEPTLQLSVPKSEVGKNAVLSCSVTPETATIEWWFQEETLNVSDRIIVTNTTIEDKSQADSDGTPFKYRQFNLTILNTTAEDAGEYTCVMNDDAGKQQSKTLDLSFYGKLISTSHKVIKENLNDKANLTLECVFEVYKPGEVKWYQKQKDKEHIELPSTTKVRNSRQIESSYKLYIRKEDDNGTYICTVWDTVNSTNITGEIDVLVYAPPKITDLQLIPISSSEVYLNWTVLLYNSAVVNYFLFFGSDSMSNRLYTDGVIDPKNTSAIMVGLNKSTEYRLKLEVKSQHGSASAEKSVKTLDSDPVFVPTISINGFSATSVTIGWPAPPAEIASLIHYYELEAWKKNGSNATRADDVVPMSAVHWRDGKNLPYMFGPLEPHSTYLFQVRACSDYTKKCGNWSEQLEAATLDGIPSKPHDVKVDCHVSQMNISWQEPVKPNAEIKGYSIELTGNATYKDRYGTQKETIWGPLTKFMTNESRAVRFDDLQPNTRYTVRLTAMTRTRRRGEEDTKYCTTKYALPDTSPRPRWRKILENNNYMFKMYLPRISERNGPICCYRVYIVRLPPHIDWNTLPPPRDLKIILYEEAHSVNPPVGAYVADIFTNDNFPPNSEVVLGDGGSIYKSETKFNDNCRQCIRKPAAHYESPLIKIPITTTTVATTTDEDYFIPSTDETEVEVDRDRRSSGKTFLIKDQFILAGRSEDDMIVKVNDGLLDSTANYTMFVELIADLNDSQSLYSEYTNVLMPAASPTVSPPPAALEIALQVTCAVAALVLLGMILYCVLQTRRSRKMPPHAHEMNRIQAVFRRVVGTMGGRQQVVGAVPPDMPPIAKEDLAAAYAERQADSDYGFQKEFELLQMLPECFPDRTTHASEARENQPKNRYPDIKAYDQTRVKLSQIDSVNGSDYINANYVMGYKERKKFICAQGPTDTTVNDFWRMIWEHGLELIVMLTNLEEYSKVKCSKYWPDEVRGARAFGNITVHHVSEKRYSDYIVRELKITKQATNADGQPIVENNGVAKRNGDVKESSDVSAPTSPREAKDTTESRIVRQYHFLVWKDFAAPEHPHSILKFIKRVNEAWSNMVGRPVVVHCSAGVGRTGTLVALDCLLDQLRATGHAAVFNTVAELRRQRNFLVQSLKQYVFVYRALVEYAHYGDTEIPASRLKACIDRLRNTPEHADKCLMEHEFEKMMRSPVVESAKSCAAGAGEEVRARNRGPDCLPYDRNRVILAPIPTRDFSTYINASFIEAYDNSEGFIITQDPLPNTIMDFWRMVSEHNVSTIVMLSEMGEGKCPRYWDDGTAQYEHISVQYEESESCPYYIRRQFKVTNTKSGEVCSVVQLQYQGWPTAPGHVPEVTRGVAELCDAADPLTSTTTTTTTTSAHAHHHHPMLVHCNLGTDRSSLFVALCILICQLRIERRVDVSCVARKVRSQRPRTIDTFLQYEFLYRAILNYAELHNLLEDS